MYQAWGTGIQERWYKQQNQEVKNISARKHDIMEEI